MKVNTYIPKDLETTARRIVKKKLWAKVIRKMLEEQ